MLLRIDSQPRAFVPIKTYRALYGLPPEFGVALFEPKDFSGLGRIDRAGAALNSVRAAVLDALPSGAPSAGWLAFLPSLRRAFAGALIAVNPQVGLKDVEIDFAVAGFGNVCEAIAYALLRARAERSAPPSFERVYADWLDSTARVSTTVHAYAHNGAAWAIHVVNHAYGRAGLMVERGGATDYVYDASLGCPAEGFMASLLAEVGARMLA